MSMELPCTILLFFISYFEKQVCCVHVPFRCSKSFLPVQEGLGCDHVPFDLQWMYTDPRRSYPGSQLNINTEAKPVPLPSVILTFPLVR